MMKNRDILVLSIMLLAISFVMAFVSFSSHKEYYHVYQQNELYMRPNNTFIIYDNTQYSDSMEQIETNLVCNFESEQEAALFGISSLVFQHDNDEPNAKIDQSINSVDMKYIKFFVNQVIIEDINQYSFETQKFYYIRIVFDSRSYFIDHLIDNSEGQNMIGG